MSTRCIAARRPPAPRSAGRCSAEFAAAYAALADPGPYRIDGAAIGRRALRNACLAYLAAADPDHGAALAKAQFDAAANMTDVLAALAVLADLDRPERAAALADFFADWEHDPLVIDKWFACRRARHCREPWSGCANWQRTRPMTAATRTGCAPWSAPFAQGNPVRFHDPSGAGYGFLADEVIAIDPSNPTTAARLVQPLGIRGAGTTWRARRLMRGQLERVLATPASARTPTRWCRRASPSGANLTLGTIHFFVMPAKAGTQGRKHRALGTWTPAFAGATREETGNHLSGSYD